MSTLAEIQKAIEKLSASELSSLMLWLQRRKQKSVSPILPAPLNIPEEEIQRIQEEIDREFSLPPSAV